MSSLSMGHGHPPGEPVEHLPFPAETVLARVRIPSAAALDEEGGAGLHPEEWTFAESKPPIRRVEFVAGRRALRRALHACGWLGDQVLLPGPQGRSALPDGYSASISHKAGWALALAVRTDGTRFVGLDSEVVGERNRSGIAEKILRPEEHERWTAEGRLWTQLLEFFSTKEAIYKALHPLVPRYIAFSEASIQGDGRIRLHLSGGEGPFSVEAQHWWEEERLITVVEARRV